MGWKSPQGGTEIRGESDGQLRVIGVAGGNYTQQSPSMAPNEAPERHRRRRSSFPLIHGEL